MGAPYIPAQRGECMTAPIQLQTLWLITDNHMLMGGRTDVPANTPFSVLPPQHTLSASFYYTKTFLNQAIKQAWCQH